MRRDDLPWVLAGLVVSALFWIDPLFVPLALLGPVVTGLVSGWRGRALRPLVLLWVVAGAGAVVSDFVVNREDVLFHVLLTVLMVALAAGAWWVTSRVGRRRAAPA